MQEALAEGGGEKTEEASKLDRTVSLNSTSSDVSVQEVSPLKRSISFNKEEMKKKMKTNSLFK